MDMHDILIAKKMCCCEGGGGGGGDSDFSTAEVTIVNNTSIGRNVENFPNCVEANELGSGSPATIYSILPVTINAGESAQFKVPLYKGTCVWAYDFNKYQVIVTGELVQPQLGLVMIQGDGTITLEIAPA